MKCQNGGFAVALVLAALILQHPVQGQDFFTIARMARATADSEPPSFGMLNLPFFIFCCRVRNYLRGHLD